MARQLELNDRRYWILSEPHGEGWKPHVVHVREDGTNDAVVIEATAGTRSVADPAAERKLRRLLRSSKA